MEDYRTVQSQWNDYQKMVLPDNAPDIQIRECRNAFYAGFYGALMAMFGLSAADESEEAAAYVLDSWDKECVAYMESVRDGK